MQSKDLRLATERDLENSIGAATAPLDQRLEDLEVSAGFTPGDINDTTTASLIRNQESDTHSELSAAIATEGVQVVRDEVPILHGHRFGIFGDPVADETAAWQAAADHIEQYGGTLEMDVPRAKINGTVLIPANFSVTTPRRNKGSVFTTPGAGDGVIETFNNLTFAPKAGVTNVRLNLSGVRFKHGASGTPVLFGGGMALVGARIDNIAAFNYGTVFDAQITGVSMITRSHFAAVKVAVGSKGIVDSYVLNNYISADSNGGFNASAFVLTGDSSHTTWGHNFFEFFKHGLRFDASGSGRFAVSGNIFDYCYAAIAANRPAVGAGPALSGLNISGNTFNRINSTLANPYFSAEDTEMTSNPWTAVDAHRGLNWSSVTGNHFIETDRGLLVDRSPVHNVREANNIWHTTPIRVEFSGIHDPSNAPQSMQDVYLESLDNQRVSVKPVNYDPSAIIYRSYFDKQRLIYNGKPVFNDNGTWRDLMGVALA